MPPRSRETWEAGGRCAMAAAVHALAKGWIGYHDYLLAKAERYLREAGRV